MKFPAKMLDRHARASLVLFVLVLVGFWGWGFFASGGLAERAIELIRTYSGEHLFVSGAIFFGFAALSVLLGPLTSAPLVPVAVLTWGKWPTFLLLVSGWMVGAMLAYLVGRTAGNAVLARIVSPANLEAWRSFLSRRTTIFSALLFRLALPAETGYVFGLVRYAPWKFLLVTVLVEIPIGVALVYSGDALVARQFGRFASWAAGGFLVMGAALYFSRRRWKALRNKGDAS